MSGVSFGQKATKVLAFLLGLQQKRALASMQVYGFGPSDVEEGWRLLRALSTYRFGAKSGAISPKVVEAVDAWENRWFEIVDASLTRNFPAVRDKVFLNLSQTEGPPVLLSVQTLVDRIDALHGTGASDEDRAAYALLERRGLNGVAISEIKALLASAAQPAETVEDLANDADTRSAAEAAMWAWYLEWSTIARRAISDRAVLRRLGFLGRKPGEPESEDDADVAEPSAPPAPPAPVASLEVKPA